MALRLEYSRAALRAFRKMDIKIARALRDKLTAYAADPAGDHPSVKALRGGGFRMRQGGYRAIFMVEESTLIVLDAGPRGDIYKD